MNVKAFHKIHYSELFDTLVRLGYCYHTVNSFSYQDLKEHYNIRPFIHGMEKGSITTESLDNLGNKPENC